MVFRRVSEGETHCFKGHPWCFLILTIWAARASVGMTGGSISGPYICIRTKAKTNSITAYVPKTPYFLCTNYVYSVIHLGNPKGISNSVNLRQN